jgi:hypothetical protein
MINILYTHFSKKQRALNPHHSEFIGDLGSRSPAGIYYWLIRTLISKH